MKQLLTALIAAFAMLSIGQGSASTYLGGAQSLHKFESALICAEDEKKKKKKKGEGEEEDEEPECD